MGEMLKADVLELQNYKILKLHSEYECAPYCNEQYIFGIEIGSFIWI